MFSGQNDNRYNYLPKFNSKETSGGYAVYFYSGMASTERALTCERRRTFLAVVLYLVSIIVHTEVFRFSVLSQILPSRGEGIMLLSHDFSKL